MDKLQEYYKNSLLANLCSEYVNDWQHASQDKKALFDLAMQQQSLPHMMTFAYNGLGLTQDYVETEFSNFINGKYTAIDVDGVKGNYKTSLYVGNANVSDASNDVYAFMWANTSRLDIHACKCPKIYIGCNSNVNISMQGYNSIVIMLFDESIVQIDECDDTCDVTIYRYSTHASVVISKYCIAKVKIHEKELRL